MKIREMTTRTRRVRNRTGNMGRTMTFIAVCSLAVFGFDLPGFAQVHGAPVTPGPAGMPTTRPANAPGRSTLNPPNAPGRSTMNPPGPAGLPSTNQPNNPPTAPANTTPNAPRMPANTTTNAPGLP